MNCFGFLSDGRLTSGIGSMTYIFTSTVKPNLHHTVSYNSSLTVTF